MKALTILALAICILLPSNATAQVRQIPTVKITARVEDPEGKPISGAGVSIGGDLNTPEKGPVPSEIKGTTDKEGKFTGEIATALGRGGALAWKEGYYRGDDGNGYSGIPLAKTGEDVRNAYETGKWEPWEREIKVVLRPVKNPVPMYVKEIVAFIPEIGKPCSYDLEIGDWVAPYGKGKQADFIFIVEGSIKSEKNYEGTLKISFSGKEDGITIYNISNHIGSDFKMPYEAPLGGYKSEWKWTEKRFTEKQQGAASTITSALDKDTVFIYRVRTISNGDGKIVKANYGRLEEAVTLSPRISGKWAIKMIYYYNPDGTRNLEYDPTKNLFKDSKTDYGP